MTSAEVLRRRRGRGGDSRAGPCLPTRQARTPRGRLRAKSPSDRGLGAQFRHALADRPTVRAAAPTRHAEAWRSGSKCWRPPACGTSEPARCTWPTVKTRPRSSASLPMSRAAMASRSICSRPSRSANERAAVKRDGLQLALWSPHEACVDPREVVAGLPEWLARRFGVDFQFDQAITAVAMPAVIAGNARWSADRLWICSGDELNLLFADQFEKCGLVRCKLQMMRSEPSRRRLADRPHAGRRSDAPPLRLVPELPEPARALPPGRPRIPVVRSPGNSCAGVPERPRGIDHRRLA